MMTESRQSTFNRFKLRSIDPRMCLELKSTIPLSNRPNFELITIDERSKVLNTFPKRSSLVPLPRYLDGVDPTDRLLLGSYSDAALGSMQISGGAVSDLSGISTSTTTPVGFRSLKSCTSR